MFRPVPSEVDFTVLEAAELARWGEHRVFERSIELRAGAEPWVFYEGPPTANGRPGLHHVWARVYKDLFCRYRTMRGYAVPRKAGWDTHGLPVEVEVEKQLGITDKRQIEEEVGIAEFTRLCRESVRNYVDEWKGLTERIGYWIDIDSAYWTFSPEYIESVWWNLKCLWDQGLLYEDIKVVPYCPRCGTPLSSHELGQPDVYLEVVDESAYVLFPLLDGGEAADRLRALLDRDSLRGLSLMAWTTTPWTLLSNTGAAVGPDLDYAVVGEAIVAADLVEQVFGGGSVVERRVSGRDLVGLRYERPFDDVQPSPGSTGGEGWRVVAGAFVEADEGTGIVHLAPAFGEIDRQVGRENGLPTLNPVGPDGRFTAEVPWLAGQSVRATNGTVNDRLEASGRLFRRFDYVHPYPHCWRCGTPLIYWGKPSWYIRTSDRKAELVAQNQTIGWHPEHIRDGRMGEWLANNVDWALSRDRFWGTPLPIWRCGRGHVHCVGSLAELSELAGRDVSGVDPHRPDIDAVTFPCAECAGAAGANTGGDEDSTMRRVEPVIDAWFDSGSMPSAQWGYPLEPGSEENFVYPADFICEAIDQTRGWFYSLLAVNTLVRGSTPYRNVLCLGHIVDADGRKMSKSIGNVIDPWEILSTRGADPLRWWMFSQGSPWTPTRVSFEVIDSAMRDSLLTLWNTWSFFTTYASLNGFDPTDPSVPAPDDRSVLDRWMRSRLYATVDVATDALDAYEPFPAATAIARLIDDASNWYVRRSRRRFWRTDPGADPVDSLGAQATLHEVLVVVAGLLAPLCPFVADRMWRDLTGAADDDSVHLADWPASQPGALDPGLEEGMALARRLASLGRAARAEAGMKVRQPLARALVYLPPGSPTPPAGVVEDELNVDRVEATGELGDVLAYELVPNFKLLGPRLGSRVQQLRAAMSSVDGMAAAANLTAGRPVVVDVDGGPIELIGDEVELRVRAQAGFAVSRDGAEVVALDLALDDDLRRRGLAREAIRQVQDLRKATGLEVSDWIHLHLVGLDDLRPLFDTVAREVLARSIVTTPPHEAGAGTTLELEDGESVRAVTIWVVKA
ncbi:MAG TPA: isoleucine--tRNA ligase [Acidimicrobiales bacterium]|nr:isoleucine--tRNA ligase [Acidimicrobiales bacterium]